MAIGHSPVVRRIRLGAELREIRKAHDKTIAQLARMIGWQASELSRLENGKLRPDLSVVMDVLDALEVVGDRRELLVSMARDANQRGWWKALSGPVFERYRQLAELESGASEIRQVTTLQVPGLLQTMDYTKSRLGRLPGFADPATLKAAIEGRKTRQQLLDHDDTRYSAVIDEAVLHRRTVPPAIMAEQMRHLVAVGQRPNIDVRILPLTAEVYERIPILSGFSLFRYADPADPRFAFVETGTLDLIMDEEEDVMKYESTFAELQADALSMDESAKIIDEAAKEYLGKGTSS